MSTTNKWDDGNSFNANESSYDEKPSSIPSSSHDFGNLFGAGGIGSGAGGRSNLDLGAVAPVFGVSTGASLDSDADYLDYDIKGRSFYQRTAYNTAICYGAGILGGGAFGIVKGVRNSPSTLLKIRLNSVLNTCGKTGSRAGNALGVLAIFYSSFEELADQFEIDNHVPEFFTRVVAGGATGALYKATAGPKPMIVAGALGAGIMAGVQFSMLALNSKFF